MSTLTYKVEVAFGSNPDSLTQTWTDVSAYVDLTTGINITRGRSDQYAQIQAGTLSLTLNNSDGRFTAGLSSSPYYPNVTLGKRIRVTASDGTHSWVRFDGRVDAWPVAWAPVAKYASASITASDRLKKLGNAPNLQNIIASEYLLDNPTAYFMLGDPANSTQAANSSLVTTTPAKVMQSGSAGQGTLTFGSATGPGTDSLTAMALVPVQGPSGLYVNTGPMQYAQPAAALTLEAFVNTTSQQAQGGVFDHDGCVVSAGTYARNGFSLIVFNGATGEIGLVYSDLYRDPELILSAFCNVRDGHTHHVAATYDSGSNMANLYFDGSSIGSAAFNTGINLPSTFNTVRVGGCDLPVQFPSAGPFEGTIAHAAVYTTALSALRIASHATAGLTGFVGERSDQRLNRLLVYSGVAPADISLETGLSTIGLQDTGASSLLSLTGQVTDTENGILFPDRASSQLKFQARSHRYGATSALTLIAGQYENDLTPVLDDYGVSNDVSVTGPGQSTARVINAASQAAMGTFATSITSVDNTQDGLLQLANWHANISGNPVVRWPSVSVDLLTQSALWVSVFGLDIGSRFTLSGLPSQAPASSVDLFAEGYSENYGLSVAKITFNASLAFDVFTLNSSTLGVLNSATPLAY